LPGVTRKSAEARQVFDDLVRFETVLWGAVDERLREECGVTLGSLNVMLVLAATPQCRVLDIAQALEITVGGTSQAVDRLETAGHCRRRANPADRRSSIVELTPEGEELLGLASPVFDREIDQFLRKPLTSNAFSEFSEAIRALRHSATPAPTSS
jgi:DNA-binding MarR family transcriptional regulator